MAILWLGRADSAHHVARITAAAQQPLSPLTQIAMGSSQFTRPLIQSTIVANVILGPLTTVANVIFGALWTVANVIFALLKAVANVIIGLYRSVAFVIGAAYGRIFRA